MRINLWLWVFALPAFSVAADPGSPTVADLSSVQSETILFEAKAKRAEAKVKMQAFSAQAGDDPSAIPLEAAPSIVASDLPTVVGVSGAGGRLLATLCYSNGSTTKAKSGQAIPGGFVLAEITLDRVIVAKGERRVPLSFVAGCSRTASSESVPLSPLLPGQMPPFTPPPPR